ncbi:MAG TPA: DUF72 domain-containing protein [Candidatus Polarisedimenticolaceae bacterium]|nr:DUF72 domain-containing protein [Candidatus Polarisedimenticolaceae bacterium]
MSRDSARGAIHAGTSGYSYKAWRGTVYPDELPQERFLRAYAERFTTVEINNTFYRFPTDSVLKQWAAETPEGFTFAIKANQRITHRHRLKNADEVTRSFVERCAVLERRLGPLLFQCPPVFRRDDERLAGFLRSLPAGARYAIEFRNKSWFEPPVAELLRQAGVAFVQSDDDKLETPRFVTSSFCYVRLRRERYDDRRLADWRRWLDARRDDGLDVFVYLKHDESGASPTIVLRSLGADEARSG